MRLYVLLALQDRITEVSWLSDADKALLRANLLHDAGGQPAGAFRDAFRDGRVWLACLIYFCAMTGLYGISFWLPTIVSEMGIKNTLSVGLITAIPYAVAGIGMVWVGRSADRRNERRWHVALPAALGALGLGMSTLLSHNAVPALSALTLAAFGILTTPSLFWSLPTAYLRGAAAAAGIAFINSFGSLGKCDPARETAYG